MSKKDRAGGMSKRQEFREKRRREQQRTQLITIGLIVVGAFLLVFFFVYPQLKPIAAVQASTPNVRPQADRNSTGDPNAPVKLTEFSDFQCPFCKNFWRDTEPQIIEAYVKTGKLQYTYRSAGNWVSGNIAQGGFESQNSAMAAYCAADQNKFWEMHDALFTNVIGEDAGSFTARRLQAIAQSIGLDMNAYNSCFSSNKYKSQTEQDFNDARAAGIQGTPFFVISYTVNGQAKTVNVNGAQSFSVFQQEIDKALSEAGVK
ncbi:MAG: thioredoxin domain-containing protein [Chloroflexi bacterium]|nr:thioredoxin domain-containing protein [Chloroflexota bacterium]